MPIISIIMPAYNKAPYIAEALDSVIAQTITDWECIVVNDGSTDNTEEIVLSYVSREPRIKYFVQPNQGVSDARNNGIKESSGEYILPLDADDVIAPTYIEKALAYFENYPDTKLVYCKEKPFGVNDSSRLPPYKYEDFIWSNCIFCSAIYRKKDFERIGGYNSSMSVSYGLEDWDFWLRLLDSTARVYQIPEELFLYRKIYNGRSVDREQNLSNALSMIYQNNMSIYEPYMKYIIEYRNKATERDYYKNALESVLHSKKYKIGKMITKPFTFLSSLFRKKQVQTC